VAWFSDPRCTNGYTWLVLDDGRIVELADPACRTPHAGACRTPKANSAFYGIAAATNGLVLATPEQLASIVEICAAVARHEGWSPASIGIRIVGHDAEAIWTKDNTPDERLWGKLGRKVDPTGVRHDEKPIVGVTSIISRAKVSCVAGTPGASISEAP
jgi:hypothetical protein